MKKSRTLSLVLAASMLIPQFALTTLASGEYNYISIEEEVIVNNGSFDEAPSVKYANRLYKNLEVGTWSYNCANANDGGTASHEYLNDGGNPGGCLRLDVANSNPALAYAVGELEAGEYTLTYDIYPEYDIGNIQTRIFCLDSNFTWPSSNSAYNRVASSASKEKWTTITMSFVLDKAAVIAFDLFGLNEAAQGDFRIDNVAIAKSTVMGDRTADLDAADNDTAYENVTTIPTEKWVSSDLNDMRFDTAGDYLYVEEKTGDSKLATNPTVIYKFADKLEPGDYRLTVVVDTEDPNPGGFQVANVSKKWSAIEEQTVLRPATGGGKYTCLFTVTGDSAIPVAFRYWPGDTAPYEPFSIESWTLEKDSGERTLTEHDPQVIVKNSSTDANNPFTIGKSTTTNIGEVAKWCLKDANYAKLSLENGVLKFAENDKENIKTPAVIYTIGTLDAGDYTISLDIKMDSGRSSGQQFEVKYPGTPKDSTKANFDPAPYVNDDPTSTSVSFNLSEKTDNCVFRFYPHNNSNKDKVQYNYTVDNFSIVKTASYSIVWTPIDSGDFTTEPSILDTAVNFDKLADEGYNGKWFLRNNSYGAVYLEYDATNTCLNIVGRSTAISGQPTVMYKFADTLSKGDYCVDIAVKSDAPDKDAYSYKIVNAATGDALSDATAHETLKSGSNEIEVNFTLTEDCQVALVIEHHVFDGRNKYINAYEIQSVTLSKIANPLLGLYSNADIAKFDSSTDGVYYLAVNAESDTYVNYCDFRELRPGIYKLSGSFRTNAEGGASVTASIYNIDCGTAQTIGNEWTSVEYTVTVSDRVTLSMKRGVKFSFNTSESVYFKDLSLVCVERLPESDLSVGILMVLLKKRQQALNNAAEETPVVDYAVNGKFDDELAYHSGNMAQQYQRQEGGKWSYSINTGEDPKWSADFKRIDEDGNGVMLVEGIDCNPSVTYKTAEVLPAGKYKFSFDIRPDSASGWFRVRAYAVTEAGKGDPIYDNTTGGSQFYYGDYTTISGVIDHPGDAPLAISFYFQNNGSFYIDNVSIIAKN